MIVDYYLIIVTFLIVDEFKSTESVKKTINLEKIEIAKKAYLLDEPNEMITDQQMKEYNIIPNPQRIQYLHNLLRKYNLYKIEKPKLNRKKLKFRAFNNKQYAIRKLFFNFGKKVKKTRKIRAKNDTESLELDTGKETGEEITIKGDKIEEDEYNYEDFKNEYYDTKEITKTNETLIAKPKVEEKKVKQAVKKIVDIKPPKNCSKEDKLSYGLKGMECLYKDIKAIGLTKDVKNRFNSIVKFWLIVYLLIAIPLWLVKGWGCCCIKLKICRPTEIIYDAKYYIVRNPPGVLEKPNGEIINYKPITEEINTFRSIELKVFRYR